MESYPKNNEDEKMETQYSEAWYRLLNQLENLKNKAEDLSLPEEVRKKAQADLESVIAKANEELDKLDAMDKEERSRRIASKSLGASELTSKQLGQKPANQDIFIDSQGFVHGSKEETLGSEPDYWQKPKDA